MKWLQAAARGALPQDDVLGVEIEGRALALYEVDGEVYATDDICTHGHARLSEGFLEDGLIECPLHQGRFCVRTGRAMGPPLTEDIRSYPVKIEDGQVLVGLDTE